MCTTRIKELALMLTLLFSTSACFVLDTTSPVGSQEGGLNSFAPADDDQSDDPTSYGFAPVDDASVDLGGFDNPCPTGFAFDVNDDQVAFCLAYGLALPQAESLAVYDHDLPAGYLGFSWSLNEDPKYTCPAEMRSLRAIDGTGYCIFSGIWVPDSETLEAYTDGLDDGILGFSWYLTLVNEEGDLSLPFVHNKSDH